MAAVTVLGIAGTSLLTPVLGFGLGGLAGEAMNGRTDGQLPLPLQ